jgi:hypothetical protein
MNIRFFAIGLANLWRAEILASASSTTERVAFSLVPMNSKKLAGV